MSTKRGAGERGMPATCAAFRIRASVLLSLRVIGRRKSVQMTRRAGILYTVRPSRVRGITGKRIQCFTSFPTPSA